MAKKLVQPNRVLIFADGRIVGFSNVPLESLTKAYMILVASRAQKEDEPENDQSLGIRKPESVGYKIRSARRRRGVSQSKLAAILEMPQPNLSQIENDKRPIGRRMAIRLGLALKMHYREFL